MTITPEERPDRQEPRRARTRWRERWGIPTSVAVHVLVIALLVFGLPLPQFLAPKPPAVAVVLVPPPEPEKPAPQEKPAEKEKPVEKEKPKEETPPAASETPPREEAKPLPSLRPVFEFGEQDAGPKKAADGSAAAEAEAPADTPERALEALDASAIPLPAPRPEKPPAEEKKLFSQSETGAQAATTAMAGLPRGQRAGELCANALRERLRRDSPLYWPDILPTYRLDKGTLMAVSDAAFRAGGQWFDLGFRCEIDEAATRVVSFDYEVGAPIPRSQWKARGFPAN